MNTLKKIVSVALIGATSLVTLGASAQAGDWRGRGYGYGPRHGYHGPAPRPYYGHYHQPRRDRSGERIATGVAIGVGALILGSILANEQRRQRHYEGY